MPARVIPIGDRLSLQMARDLAVDLNVSVDAVHAARALGITVEQLLGAVRWVESLKQEQRAAVSGAARRRR